MSDKNKNGFLYLRDNPWFATENVFKLGISFSLLDRANTYITGEVYRGRFLLVLDIGMCSPLRLRVIEKLVTDHFQSLHRNYGGGIEFFDRSILDRLPPFLDEHRIAYRILQETEIQERVQYERRKRFQPLLRRMFDQWSHVYQNSLQPYDFQKDVLQHIPLFFQMHDKLKLIWPCGLGKALFSLFVVKKMRSKTVLIGVPSIFLQKQMKQEILRLFPSTKNILGVGSVETTSPDEISSFLQIKSTEPTFVITTYHSCPLFLNLDFTFDVKIADEAHHLVGTRQNTFCAFHQIRSHKSLFMTATEKTLETKNASAPVYSMDDENVFGYCIDRKSVQWAIENKKITDYNILVLKNTEEEVDAMIRNHEFEIQNKELFLSCYMCLKAMETYSNLTHMLLYTNTVENAITAMRYVQNILSKGIVSIPLNECFNRALHSQHGFSMEMELEEFKHSRYGIISCVYLFGEGFDLPRLNGVCVAENMQSEIRIVQYLLRPNRLDNKDPDKISFIVLPYMDTDDWEQEKKSFEKIRKVISQMRNSDETIEQKLRFCILKEEDRDQSNSELEFQGPQDQGFDCAELWECLSELERLKLRLRQSKTLKSKHSEEEDEYLYVRSVNQRLLIQSEEEYTESRPRHPYYVENAEVYFKSRGVWNGWKDFLNIEGSFFYSWNDWITCCRERDIQTREEYEEGYRQDLRLPKVPEYVYPGFSNLLNELARIHRKRRKTRN